MSIGRLIRLAIIGWIVGMVVGMVSALSVKRRIVPTTDEAAEEVELAAIFGPLNFHSTSSAFRGGLLEAWYGGGVLDLRDATLAPEGATLRVRAIFAGAQVVVPVDWKIVSRISGMGGVSDMRENKGDAIDAPELVIEGTVFAGGIAVVSALDENVAEWTDKAAWGSGWTDKSAWGEKSGWSQRRKMGFGKWKRDADETGTEVAEAVGEAGESVADAATDASEKAGDAAASLAEALDEAASGDEPKAESEMAPAT